MKTRNFILLISPLMVVQDAILGSDPLASCVAEPCDRLISSEVPIIATNTLEITNLHTKITTCLYFAYL